ncbi:waprin-Enh1-like [Hemicordylus capensis]|uniref:waprin-Enh1-like n=1 Tax=Hemicordylus capensis TaxID=884348 RepID=UPI0023038016|nr:waprin-Enh1-like [Hemicordylus capensis]
MPFVVPGICPRNPFPCSLPGFDRCRSDYECPRNQKCCSYRCGRACRVTQVIRSSCSRIPGWCTVPGIDRCSSDYDCPGRKRCCYYNCARTCRLL